MTIEYRYAEETLDFSTDGATAAELQVKGRSTITVNVDGGGDTGDFDLEYAMNDDSDWQTWKSYSAEGDVDETVTIACWKVRLKTTSAGSGDADVELGASD